MSPRVEPHEGGVLDTKTPYSVKRDVHGLVVAVFHARASARELQLTVHPSRAVLKHEIHELLVTNDQQAGRNRTVNQVAYIGCVEMTVGGMILAHDRVEIAGKEVGRVVGFDETHSPNHMNIVLRTTGQLLTGQELGVKIGDGISFAMGSEPANLFD